MLEVIVTGNRVRVLVGGNPVVDYTDDQVPMKRGGNIFLQMTPGTRVTQYRNIAIKEMKLEKKR